MIKSLTADFFNRNVSFDVQRWNDNFVGCFSNINWFILKIPQ